MLSYKNLEKFSQYLDGALILGSLITLLWWLSGAGLFYSYTSPVMSPFTSLSLLLMSSARLCEKKFDTFSKTITLAILGIVVSGNFSSLLVQWLVPDLFLKSIPTIVPTSPLTSIGLILFCFYEALVIIRKTPNSAFIFDDILLLLALFPGGLSLLGHMLNIPAYMSSTLDMRVGISLMEMAFMGTFAVVAVISNPNLFLWRFLAKNWGNRMVFVLLFTNQFIAPFIVRTLVYKSNYHQPGIEFFVMLAGVLATLIFLITYAIRGK